MIQFNLLPNVKLQYIKAKRMKRIISAISVFLAAAALAIMVILVTGVDVIQKAHLKNLSNQITTSSTKLKNIPNLNEALTVQDEVNALPGLYSQGFVQTRLPGYLAELTPTQATISDVNLDYTTDIISITGTAADLATINQYVDTLKLSSYQTSPNSTPKNAFSDVILASFAYATTQGATYNITATFDPTIFAASYTTVTLNVPSTTSTRISTNQSNALFQQQPASSSNTSTGQ